MSLHRRRRAVPAAVRLGVTLLKILLLLLLRLWLVPPRRLLALLALLLLLLLLVMLLLARRPAGILRVRIRVACRRRTSVTVKARVFGSGLEVVVLLRRGLASLAGLRLPLARGRDLALAVEIVGLLIGIELAVGSVVPRRRRRGAERVGEEAIVSTTLLLLPLLVLLVWRRMAARWRRRSAAKRRVVLAVPARSCWRWRARSPEKPNAAAAVVGPTAGGRTPVAGRPVHDIKAVPAIRLAPRGG